MTDEQDEQTPMRVGVKDRVRHILRTLFSRGETATVGGRSQDRYRRAAWTSVATMAARLANMGAMLVAVPVLLGYLGTDRFGLWAALVGSIGFLAFTDMGLGIGLQNALSECHGRGDRKSPASYVSSNLALMFCMLTGMVLVGLFLLPMVPLHRLIKTESAIASRELLPTAQAIVIVFGLGLPTAQIIKIYNAYQQGYYGQILVAIGRTVGLGGIIICAKLQAGLPVLAAVYMGAPFAVMAISSILLFVRNSWLRPSVRLVSLSAMKRLFGTGLAAMGAQISIALLLGGPMLIIANRLNTEAVTPFAVTRRLSGLAYMLLLAGISPLWPAYGEAATRGEWQWVRKTIRRSSLAAMAILLPLTAGMILAGRPIIRLWTGVADSVPNWSLLLACVTVALMQGGNIVYSMALNGLDRMRGQALYGTFFSLLALTVAFFVVRPWGVAAAIWAMALVGYGLRVAVMRVELFSYLRGKT